MEFDQYPARPNGLTATQSEPAGINLDCCDKHEAAEMQRDVGAYSSGARLRDIMNKEKKTN